MTKTIMRKQGKDAYRQPTNTVATYQDPVQIQEWADSSAAGMEPFTELGTTPYFQGVGPIDSLSHLAMGFPISQSGPSEPQMQNVMMGQSQGLGFGAHCIPTSASIETMYDVNADMTGLSGCATDFLLVQNDSNFDGCMTLPIGDTGYPSPGEDDLSFMDSAGSHPMCVQTSGQGYAQFPTEWESGNSSPDAQSVPMTHASSESQSMTWTTSDFGTSLGSQPSHLISPLSMAPTDEIHCPISDATAYGPTGHYSLPTSPPDHFQLAPAIPSEDQRTIRPGAHTQRPALYTFDEWSQTQNYNHSTYQLPPPARRAGEGEPTVTARKHHLYKRQPGGDGLYHCPFEKSEKCTHQAEKLKCNYDKHLDSHLKPYRCSRSECATLQFSSTACLLRHEREAHALHGHGDKPYRCQFHTCDRAQHGQGFPRLWNLRDHMRRVHDYIAEESPANKYPSPESSHSSDEAIGPYVRRRSPETSQAGITKRCRTKASKKDTQRDQEIHVQEYLGHTHTRRNTQEPRIFEPYYCTDRAQSDAMSQRTTRKDPRHARY